MADFKCTHEPPNHQIFHAKFSIVNLVCCSHIGVDIVDITRSATLTKGAEAIPCAVLCLIDYCHDTNCDLWTTSHVRSSCSLYLCLCTVIVAMEG